MQRYLLLAVCVLCARATASTGLLVWYDSMYFPENTIYSNSTSAADLFQFINNKVPLSLSVYCSLPHGLPHFLSRMWSL